MASARAAFSASLVVALQLVMAIPAANLSAAFASPVDTLEFEPLHPEDEDSEPRLIDREVVVHRDLLTEPTWLQAPFRVPLSATREAWPLRNPGESALGIAFDYNRVDEIRAGLTWEAQANGAMSPRLGARGEYSSGRRRWLYGVHLEQPLEPGNHVAVGVSLGRKTDHIEMQQVGDLENSLALLFGRQDYRDYFESEGTDGYVALRWPGVTTLSLHGRNERYRSLETYQGTRSWFHRRRALRENPPIAPGEAHVAAVRIERVHPGEVGFHHWVELEAAGGDLGGDFRYRRLLADLRSVIRLSPTTTLSLRGVVGSVLGGSLPPQRAFTVGGVDGLRAHSFAAFHGDQAALGQLEYGTALGAGRRGLGGLHAIAFVDAGRAWVNPDAWDIGRQRIAADGGFGLSTAEDKLRVYFAKNLQDPESDFVISARLQRPF
jgi:hypothetical protein